jgi:hypothetical protein
MDVPALLAEVTRAWEAAATVKTTPVTAILAVDTSTQEVATVRDSVALHAKDAEDWATLAEREALEKVWRVEAENAMALASTHEDVEGFVPKFALFEGKLAVECQAWEVSKRECWEQFEELTRLQTPGSELCHAIVRPPQARYYLSEGMRHAALHHTEMVRELAVLQVTVSSVVESALGHSPNDTFHVEVVGELVTKF